MKTLIETLRYTFIEHLRDNMKISEIVPILLFPAIIVAIAVTDRFSTSLQIFIALTVGVMLYIQHVMGYIEGQNSIASEAFSEMASQLSLEIAALMTPNIPTEDIQIETSQLEDPTDTQLQ